MVAIVSNLGASLTHYYLPSTENGYDDIVLGYRSQSDMYRSKNPPYLGVVVGRVANRIKDGILHWKDGPRQLEINNAPNHLHGGSSGFSTRIWDVEVEDDEVIFSLLSVDGDQNYPGTIVVKVSYRLDLLEDTHPGKSKLRVNMTASLVNNDPAPVNLALHTYFNLASHDDRNGILDHTLSLNSEKYTPLDFNSIPTREVKSVDEDTTMDFREPRELRQALCDYARNVLNVDEDTYNLFVESLRQWPTSDESNGKLPSFPSGLPFGLDHNFVIKSNSEDTQRLSLAATIKSETTGRQLEVLSNVPGVQVYTANYLDGRTGIDGVFFKDGATYKPWQAICLETQHFPDSIGVASNQFPAFAKGKCIVLDEQNRDYSHELEYVLNSPPRKPIEVDRSLLVGSDTDDNQYSSLEEMWTIQLAGDGKTAWYNRAADYYEENCDSTIDGVLGGFAELSDVDLANSREFVQHIENVRSIKWSDGAACECGAGLGRVTKGLLLSLGPKRCDLVESSSRLLCTAPEYIGAESSKCRFYCQGLQEWEPNPNTYSIMWIQWVLCYLTDEDTVSFLRRCAMGLVPGGIIVLKENTCTGEGFVVDVEDASITRSLHCWLSLATEAGLSLVIRRPQTQFPSDMFPVEQLAFEISAW